SRSSRRCSTRRSDDRRQNVARVERRLRLHSSLPRVMRRETRDDRSLFAAFPDLRVRASRTRQSGSVRRTGKEDGREYELKPSIVVQRVQLPPGKGQSASRKPALRVTAMVARSVGEQVPKLRESASKSTNAEALVVRIAGAASM